VDVGSPDQAEEEQGRPRRGQDEGRVTRGVRAPFLPGGEIHERQEKQQRLFREHAEDGDEGEDEDARSHLQGQEQRDEERAGQRLDQERRCDELPDRWRKREGDDAEAGRPGTVAAPAQERE
jgi:hypothetical protein